MYTSKVWLFALSAVLPMDSLQTVVEIYVHYCYVLIKGSKTVKDENIVLKPLMRSRDSKVNLKKRHDLAFLLTQKLICSSR